MKKLSVIVVTAAAGLVLAGTAHAGCMATVGLSPLPPQGQAARTPWIVTVRVLQHGRTPMADAKPEVRIQRAGGKMIVFKGTATSRVGSYRFRVVFPRAGRYSLAVYDGFPVKECAQVHTFKPVVVVAV